VNAVAEYLIWCSSVTNIVPSTWQQDMP